MQVGTDDVGEGYPKRTSDHLNDLALGVVASLDVQLGRGQAGMTRQLLDITKRSTGLNDLVRGLGHEGAPS